MSVVLLNLVKEFKIKYKIAGKLVQEKVGRKSRKKK